MSNLEGHTLISWDGKRRSAVSVCTTQSKRCPRRVPPKVPGYVRLSNVNSSRRAALTPETERLLVAPLKAVMDHISEAFHVPRRRSSGSSSNLLSRGQERMEWSNKGLGAWVASLAEQVRLHPAATRNTFAEVIGR